MEASLHTLLSAIVDYAGLFPPAQLDLATAIAQYQHHQTEPQSWMLGRFVLKLSQFEQFLQHIPAGQSQVVSLILDGEPEIAIKQLSKLIQSDPLSIQIAALEIPPYPLSQLVKILPQLPEKLEVYCEFFWEQDWKSYLKVLPSHSVGLKIRTGGLAPQAFPSSEQLSLLIFSLAQAGIPFKATAGLHHPLPKICPLSTEPNSLLAAMHGFLNVAIAASFAYTQTTTLKSIQAILETKTVRDFNFTEQEIGWLDHRLNLAEIQRARSQFFRSFGSCSVQEPIEDLKQLSLLD
jgi:hypothetical protein